MLDGFWVASSHTKLIGQQNKMWQIRKKSRYTLAEGLWQSPMTGFRLLVYQITVCRYEYLGKSPIRINNFRWGIRTSVKMFGIQT